MYNYIPGSVMDNVVTVNSLCNTIDGTQQLSNDSIYHSEKVKNLDIKHTFVFIVSYCIYL